MKQERKGYCSWILYLQANVTGSGPTFKTSAKVVIVENFVQYFYLNFRSNNYLKTFKRKTRSCRVFYISIGKGSHLRNQPERLLPFAVFRVLLVWGRDCHGRLQSVGGYLGLALVFVWVGGLRGWGGAWSLFFGAFLLVLAGF